MAKRKVKRFKLDPETKAAAEKTLGTKISDSKEDEFELDPETGKMIKKVLKRKVKAPSSQSLTENPDIANQSQQSAAVSSVKRKVKRKKKKA